MTDKDLLIGGHIGMDVIRAEDKIIKQVHHRTGDDDRYKINKAALHNEAKFLRVMENSGFTPRLLNEFDESIVQEDIGEKELVTDGEAFRRNCIRFLYTLRERNVRHGDLTGANIIIRDNWPFVIDWQEAHFIGEKGPQKQPFSDTYLLWRTIGGTIAKDGTYDTPRVARRWLAVAGALGAIFNLNLPLKGQTFLDLGCFQGDFCAAATCEGMITTGVDSGGFRSGEDSIAIGKDLWEEMSINLLKKNILEIEDFHHDVIIMFSTWSYIVLDYGKEVAIKLLKRIIQGSKVFFFENQLYGDGPGPDFFKDDDDIGKLLKSLGGEPTSIITIPVWGRSASRTVWKVI